MDFLTPGISDHSPTLVQYLHIVSLHPKPFKLYALVMQHHQFQNSVQQVWHWPIRGGPMTVLWERLKKLKLDDKELNTYMTSYAQKIFQDRQQLEILHAQITSQLNNQSLFDQEKTILSNIQRWSLVEEQVLR